MSDTLKDAREALGFVVFARAIPGGSGNAHAKLTAALDELERAQARIATLEKWLLTASERKHYLACIAELEADVTKWKGCAENHLALLKVRWREEALNPAPPPSGKAECEIDLGNSVCLRPCCVARPPELAPYKRTPEEAERDIADLRAQLAAAQARVKELEEDVSQAADPIENMELQHRVDWETELKVAAEKLAASRLELLVAATERAEKAERELIAARELSESRGNHNAKLALERDAAMDGGTQAVWKLRCSRWESKAALMQNERDAYKKALEFTQSESRRLADQAYDLGKERDAAIKAKEEAERARDEHKEFRDDYLKALLDVREERDAERKRADEATAQWKAAEAAYDMAHSEGFEDSRDHIAQLEATAGALRAALENAYAVIRGTVGATDAEAENLEDLERSIRDALAAHSKAVGP